MPDIVIYTKSWCGYCTRAKALLARKGAKFQEIEIPDDESLRDEMVARAGSVQVDGEGVSVRLTGGEALAESRSDPRRGAGRGLQAARTPGGRAARPLGGGPHPGPGRLPGRGARPAVASGHLVAFSMDRPLYYSVHSAAVRLAPEGMAVIHVAKYLAGGAAADEGELEEFLDRLQAGWTAHVVDRCFLPGM